jgi:hypothetical protein
MALSDITAISEIRLGSSMPGFLLIVLNRADTARACQRAAAQIADAISDARIIALIVRVDPTTTIFLASKY